MIRNGMRKYGFYNSREEEDEMPCAQALDQYRNRSMAITNVGGTSMPLQQGLAAGHTFQSTNYQHHQNY
jgi:hypothetical protein